MNAFIFASGVNEKGLDADWGFRLGAEEFKKIHQIPQPICYFDWRKSRADRRKKIIDDLISVGCDDPEGLDAVVYFGHGQSDALLSAGFYSPQGGNVITDEVQDLANMIVATSKHDVKVILYCCSSGKLMNSFAGSLSAAMAPMDARVYGHTVKGHTFANAYVSLFESSMVGSYLVEEGSKAWPSWKLEMDAANTKNWKRHQLWALFPFMDPAVLNGGILCAS